MLTGKGGPEGCLDTTVVLEVEVSDLGVSCNLLRSSLIFDDGFPDKLKLAGLGAFTSNNLAQLLSTRTIVRRARAKGSQLSGLYGHLGPVTTWTSRHGNGRAVVETLVPGTDSKRHYALAHSGSWVAEVEVAQHGWASDDATGTESFPAVSFTYVSSCGRALSGCVTPSHLSNRRSMRAAANSRRKRGLSRNSYN